MLKQVKEAIDMARSQNSGVEERLDAFRLVNIGGAKPSYSTRLNGRAELGFKRLFVKMAFQFIKGCLAFRHEITKRLNIFFGSVLEHLFPSTWFSINLALERRDGKSGKPQVIGKRKTEGEGK